MIFEIFRGEGKLTGWGKNGPAHSFPGEKTDSGGKFRPVTAEKHNDESENLQCVHAQITTRVWDLLQVQ